MNGMSDPNSILQESSTFEPTLLFNIPGLSYALKITLPDKDLAVCGKCKTSFKSRKICRLRNRHTAPPWTSQYICITLDESAIDRMVVDRSSAKLSLPMRVRLTDMPLEVKHVSSVIPSTPADRYILDSSSFGSDAPCCIACKATNRSKFVCRVKEKHPLLPWNTIFATVGRADDWSQVMPNAVVTNTPVAEGSDSIHNVHPSLSFLVEISSHSCSLHWLSLKSDQYENSFSSNAVNTSMTIPGNNLTPAKLIAPQNSVEIPRVKRDELRKEKVKIPDYEQVVEQQMVNGNILQRSLNPTTAGEQNMSSFQPMHNPYASLLPNGGFRMNVPIMDQSRIQSSHDPTMANAYINYPSSQSQLSDPVNVAPPFSSSQANRSVDLAMLSNAASLAPSASLNQNIHDQLYTGYYLQQLNALENRLQQERMALQMNQHRYSNLLQQQRIHQLQQQQLHVQNVRSPFPLGPSIPETHPYLLRHQLMLRQAQAASSYSSPCLLQQSVLECSFSQRQSHDEPTMNEDKEDKRRKPKRVKKQKNDDLA